MYTAYDAQAYVDAILDDRIQYAVATSESLKGAYIRVRAEDPWNIREELERRGFKNIHCPEFIIISGDVYFEW